MYSGSFFKHNADIFTVCSLSHLRISCFWSYMGPFCTEQEDLNLWKIIRGVFIFPSRQNHTLTNQLTDDENNKHGCFTLMYFSD